MTKNFKGLAVLAVMLASVNARADDLTIDDGKQVTNPVVAPSPKASPKVKKDINVFYLPVDEIIPGANIQKKRQELKLKKKSQGAIKSEKFTDLVGLDIDRTKYATPVVSQNTGDCTTHGMATVVEGLLRLNTDPNADYSQRSLWSWQNKVANVEAARSAAMANFVKDEAGWPYGKVMPLPEQAGRYKVLDLEYLGNQDTKNIGHKVAAAFKAGKLIYWGGSVSQDMASCYYDIRGTSSATNGGHSTGGLRLQVPDEDTMWMSVKNHWGKDCGINGFQRINLKSCDLGYCYFYALGSVLDRKTGITTKAIPVDGPAPTPSPSASPSVIKQVINGKTYECKEQL